MVTAFYVERRPFIATLTVGGAITALCSLSWLGIYLWIASRGCPDHDYDSLRCMAARVEAGYGAVGVAGLTLLALVCGLLHQVWLVVVQRSEWSSLSPLALGLQGVVYLLVQRGGMWTIAAALGSSIIGVSCITVSVLYYCARGLRKPLPVSTKAERQPLVDVKHVL
jgi:hypothetical protein